MEKFIKFFVRFLQTSSLILTGSVVGSLWLHKNEDWRISLPILLLVMTLERFLSRDNESNI